MVFKGRFFSSKKSDTSSPEGSNSPRSLGSNSPNRSEKKKVKSAKDDPPPPSVSCRQIQVKQQQQPSSLKNKDAKGKETQPQILGFKSRKSPEAKEVPATVSPILASSLGLNRIKTRSGPLPQESFFGFRGDKGSGSSLGASNLSKPAGAGDGCFTSSSGKSGGKRKGVISEIKAMGGSEENVSLRGWVDNGSYSDSMSTESGLSRDQSPHIQVRSRLRNGESSSESNNI